MDLATIYDKIRGKKKQAKKETSKVQLNPKGLLGDEVKRQKALREILEKSN